MELLIGCGRNHERKLNLGPPREWSNLITLDMNEEHKPDVIWDLEQLPLPFEDDKFDEIHAMDVLEHTGRQGDWRFFFSQWQEFWRILKPDGVFFLLAPHPDGIWAWADPGHTRVLSRDCLVFLDQAQYAAQVGKTPMTDYRPWYKGDFRLLAYSEQHDKDRVVRFAAVLQAVKPARVAE